MEHIKESNGKMMLVIGQWSLGSRQWAIVNGQWASGIRQCFACLLLLSFISSCSVSKQIGKQASTILLNDTAISTGHIGISIYEPATDKYWYNYNAIKYFIPASNTKLFTLYAGMKYLGDSLVGLRYYDVGHNYLQIRPTADPTFLHPDFISQPVFDFLHNSTKNLYFISSYWKAAHKGNGWAWNDFSEAYMAERSAFPIYGNLIKVFFKDDILTSIPLQKGDIGVYTEKWWEKPNKQLSGLHRTNLLKNFSIKRTSETSSSFAIFPSTTEFTTTYIPRVIYDQETIEILNDTIKSKIPATYTDLTGGDLPKPQIIHSQPSDSFFKPMMHRSDNFFAEQTLLMVSNEHLGYMSDEKIIDTLLKTDLKDIPQRPRWVDGSGLSRYNLFTPQSFVYILNKTKNEFGWDRVKNILPTGGKGTLSSYYKKDSSFIYAKTGTLSNNCALSGYLITKKGKVLIFSILANNYMTGATPVRRAVEKFLLAIRENY